MIPYILTALGGYLIGSSVKQYAKGGQVQLLAPNGKPSNLTPEQYKLVRTPEFKAWFGDWENDHENASKVVDENGEPLVVYHGTPYGSFTKFEKAGLVDSGWLGLGFYFHKKKNQAIAYSLRGVQSGSFPHVFEVFLNIKKIYSYEKKLNKKILLNKKNIPDTELENFYFDSFEEYDDEGFKNSKREWLLEKYLESENDYEASEYMSYFINRSEIIQYLGYQGVKGGEDEYVCFNSNQIKLADGTNTTFDSANPDIRYADGGEVGLAPNRFLAPNGKPSNLLFK